MFEKIKSEDLDWSCCFWCQKVVLVRAHFVPPDTAVTTVMKDGFVETTNVSKDAETLCVTNPDGEQYLVPAATFFKKYDLDNGRATPKPFPVQGIEAVKDVSFKAPWGEEMFIRKGGVLIKTGEDFYGIQDQEFQTTYARLKTASGAGFEKAQEDAKILLNSLKHSTQNR